jgi:5'-AMP-activated protein kinase regulatory beta subunit
MARKQVQKEVKSASKPRKRVEFTYRGKPGNVVFVAGSFNDWDVLSRKAKLMTDAKGDGHFRKVLVLAPGQYEFKFWVDGEWIADDKAKWVRNAHGTLNSVLEVL